MNSFQEDGKMKKTRFTEEQIVKILQQQEAGMKVGEICREHGISDQTFYNWKAKYGGMTVSEIRRMKALETENLQLKKLVAEQALSIQGLKEVLGKKL
jgi:putative transposase